MKDRTRGDILVLNSGSSSLKFAVYENRDNDESLLLHGSAQRIGRADGNIEIRTAAGEQILAQEHLMESQQAALAKLAAVLLDHLRSAPAAVGHRIVHGGPHLREHQPLTPEVLSKLEAATHFAPLHIPQALNLVRHAQNTFPEATHIACFDTAFHRTLPEVAAHLPLPQRYFNDGVMRYGFHGLSYESIVRRLGRQLPRRAVFAHLGNGCSLAAVLDGQSIDTSMGLTPTGGVPMSTRSGDLDPGVLVYLLRTEGIGADALEDLLNRHSGLAGISGGESDMQVLVARSRKNDTAAELAINEFCTGVRKYIGAYAALMGGIDLLVFTGGIGEHSAEIRTRICRDLDFLGVGVSSPRVQIMASDEEGQIARHCRALLVRASA